jgi:cytochrome oxidase Cu insertion factor (SCO1/SenC/PrrC family)
MSKKGDLRGQRARMGIVPAILVGVLLALATPLDADEETRRLLQALWVDTPARPTLAPQFSLPDVNGAAIRLAELQGRIVMLYFWTTW